MKEKLKPCPFCGGPAKKEQARGSFGGYGLTKIYCQNCGTSVKDQETWNNRSNQSKNNSLTFFNESL